MDRIILAIRIIQIIAKSSGTQQQELQNCSTKTTVDFKHFLFSLQKKWAEQRAWQQVGRAFVLWFPIPLLYNLCYNRSMLSPTHLLGASSLGQGWGLGGDFQYSVLCRTSWSPTVVGQTVYTAPRSEQLEQPQLADSALLLHLRLRYTVCS